MSFPFSTTLWGRASRTRPSGRPTRTRLVLEQLEDRCLLTGTVTITAIQGPSSTSAAVPAATEGLLASPSLMATFTDTSGLSAADLTAQVNHGDGTPVSTATITRIGATDQYTVTDTHLFPEESGSTVPPFSFSLQLTVFENANPNTNTDTATTQAEVVDAPLSN